jgi:glycosyltransferase involved in cell wall biosynthesis
MKIAFVSSEYPPFQGGGIGTYATLMARLFTDRGHEVHVITNLYPSASEPDQKQPYTKIGNLHIHRVKGISDGWGPPPNIDWQEIRLHREWSPYLAYSNRVADCLEMVHKEFGLDIAEFPECAAEGYCSIHRRRLGLGFSDLPMTVTLHSPIEDIYRFNHYSRQNLGFQRRKTLEESSIIEADGINAPSERMLKIVQARLQGNSKDGGPWDVVRLPLEVDPYIEPQKNDPGESLSVIAVGRVEPRKGVIDLVDAAASLFESNPDFQIEFFGRVCDAGVAPGPMDDYLRSRLPEEHRDRLVFHGQVSHEEVTRSISSAVACAFASRWDNYPVACLEAMGAGVCCIVSDGIGTAEVLTDGQDALVFAAGDIQSLQEKIEWALANIEQSRLIGSNAISTVSSVADSDTAVDSRIAHYDRVISAATAPSSQSKLSRSVVWKPTGNTTTDESVRESAMHAEAELTEAANHASAWELDVSPGDHLEVEAIATLLSVLEARPDAAWAASWTRPSTTKSSMYAGHDFTLPLDLMVDAAPRTTLSRSNSNLPDNPCGIIPPSKWRELDRRLALKDAGWAGVIVPLWLSTSATEPQRSSTETLDPDRIALILEMIIERHPGIFEQHGASLWLYATANIAPHHPTLSTELGFRGLIELAFKGAIKKRFPRLTASARRMLNRVKT